MTPELQAFLDALDDQQSAAALAYLMNRNGGVQVDSGGTPIKQPVPPPTSSGH